MAVKIRRSKASKCESCQSNGGKFYDIGIGPQGVVPSITVLCDTCMHSLLTKLIEMGAKHEVH